MTTSGAVGGYATAMNVIRPSTIPSAAWRFAEGCLVELRFDGEARLWGPWSGRFGCWAANGAAAVPEWEPIGSLGVWHEPAGPRDDGWYASRAALAAYWSQVPTRIRLDVSRLGRGQWTALLTAWRQVTALDTAIIHLLDDRTATGDGENGSTA